MQVRRNGTRCGLDMPGSGAACVIVDVIENHVETLSRKRGAHGLAVVAIRLYVLHSPAELMLSATVENRDGVTSLEQICHKCSPKEARTADYQTIHSFVGVWLVVILKSQVRDEVFAAHPS